VLCIYFCISSLHMTPGLGNILCIAIQWEFQGFKEITCRYTRYITIFVGDFELSRYLNPNVDCVDVLPTLRNYYNLKK
jgi:hypothetical protein